MQEKKRVRSLLLFAFIRLLVIVKMKKRKKPVVDVQGARLKSKLNPERGC